MPIGSFPAIASVWAEYSATLYVACDAAPGEYELTAATRAGRCVTPGSR